ncbi:MAG: transglutaminase-like domain-containing protein [Candidatus Dojkabacteria bacterium]|nr:transglutaminase-like domain-containing protein [Candidatus Dojkabacteria bacterium]
MKKLIYALLLIPLIFNPSIVKAASYDFEIESNMEIKYVKNTDYVTVTIEYIREVNNSSYYFPATGDKTFPIPDLSSQTENQITAEREFKKDSITVKDSSGKKVNFSIEDQDDSIDIIVPNYKETTRTLPYKIYITYNTHDYVQVVNQNVVIQAPSLPEDTEFEMTHEDTGTETKVSYNLDILVDKDLQDLSKIWPTTYSFDEGEDFNTYTFSQDSRLGKNPYLEFGTSQIYRFELSYTTPQTDSFIPESYSKLLGNISKNIFELSLPRYFDETNQTVKIESISPTPTKIGVDSEGNIIVTFEVDANKESTISVTGYILVSQDPLEDKTEIPNPSISEYTSVISADTDLSKYLTETQYWEVNDSYVQDEANNIKSGETNVLDLIKADYRYINEKLEYDQTKADSTNDRIGAKQALQGESSVCMEYADAMITILRAQGIAARAAIGYANLREASDTPTSQVRHQWVQVWLPDYGWLSIDPTWESENMDIGQNIHKILWETFNDDELSNTRIYSADSLDSINNIEFNISVYAVDESDIESIDTLKTYEEILPIEEIDNGNNIGDWLNKFIKASTIGRSVAIVLPILLIIVFLIIITTVIRIVIKKIKKNKNKKI